MAQAAPEAALAARPMLPRPFRVLGNRKETRDTVTLELAPPAGERADFLPGQFNMLYAPGLGEVPISISGAGGGGYLHTVRAVGAVSAALAGLKRGDTVGLRGPFGSAWPLREAVENDVVVMAGGIGLAPLRPAVRALLADRSRYGRILVLYGARSPSELLYIKELEGWRSHLDIEVGVTVDRSERGWRGRVGVVTTLLSGVRLDPKATTAFLCGPEVMLRFALPELERAGMSLERAYVSMERNMKCGVGLCGHCQFGPAFVCKDGPVFPYPKVRDWLAVREL